MKKFWYFIIFGLVSLVIILANVFIIIFAKVSWWWIFVSIGLVLLSALVIGIIILILNLKTKKIKVKSADVKKIKEKMVNEIKIEEDNPDNFKIDKDGTRIMNVGNPGKPKTKVLWCRGVGTETGAKINVICDMNKPKEMFRIDNPSSEEYMIECIRTFAENPEEKVITETEQGRDIYGNPTFKSKTIKGLETPEEKEKEKEKELRSSL